MVYLLAYVALTENTARLPASAFDVVTLSAAFNAAVGSVYLCVADFHDVAVLPVLEALGGLHDFTYLARRPIHAIQGLLKKLPGCLYWQPEGRLLHATIDLPDVDYSI